MAEKQEVFIYHDRGSRASGGLSFSGVVPEQSYHDLDVGARKLAYRTIFVVLAGTAIGSMAPEFGTALAYNIGIPPHIFNWLFLAVGVTGISLAFYSRHRKSV